MWQSGVGAIELDVDLIEGHRFVDKDGTEVLDVSLEKEKIELKVEISGVVHGGVLKMAKTEQSTREIKTTNRESQEVRGKVYVSFAEIED